MFVRPHPDPESRPRRPLRTVQVLSVSDPSHQDRVPVAATSDPCRAAAPEAHRQRHDSADRVAFRSGRAAVPPAASRVFPPATRVLAAASRARSPAPRVHRTCRRPIRWSPAPVDRTRIPPSESWFGPTALRFGLLGRGHVAHTRMHRANAGTLFASPPIRRAKVGVARAIHSLQRARCSVPAAAGGSTGGLYEREDS